MGRKKTKKRKTEATQREFDELQNVDDDVKQRRSLGGVLRDC
jgi:hypothetical protein